MCLYVYITGEYYRRTNPGVNTITVYKMLARDGNNHYSTPYQGYPVNPGCTIKAASTANDELKIGDIVEGRGVHAYISYEKALRDCRSMIGRVIVQCEAPVEDIVAFGVNGDIALTKLTLPNKLAAVAG